MNARLLEHLPLKLEKNGVADIEQFRIGFDTFTYHQIGKMPRELTSVRLAIDAFGKAGQVVLGFGILDVGQ